MDFEIRRAKPSDIKIIYKLIANYAREGKLLRRTPIDLHKNLKDFYVAVSNGELVGCICFDIYNRKLAEIRSLAVSSKCTGRGIGAALVSHCISLAKKRKVLEVMVITSRESFFKHSGFNYSLPGERKALFVNP